MLADQITTDLKQAIESLVKDGTWPELTLPDIRLDRPDQEVHGDFASNISMQLAPQVKKSPLEIAGDIKDRLTGEYDKVQIVHPGFLNIFVGSSQLAIELAAILEAGDGYGDSEEGKGQKILLEFISANPTGPLTLPNGRGGYLGDVLARAHKALGYKVTTEYYVNDRGNQIDILGESVARRWLQKQGVNVPYPEELYQGDYISDLADQLEMKDYKLTNLKKMEWVKGRVKELALQLMLKEIQRVVKDKMKIKFDVWNSEKQIYDQKLPEVMLAKLQEIGSVYQQEGATWLKTSEFGDDKDRVLIKSSGEGAYLQGDLSLFYERSFTRRQNKVIVILGADHHGYEKRLKALPKLLKSDTEFDLIFTQMATLMKDGQEVRMSKRKGNFVTIEELIDEVGNDVARFFFLMYSANRHLNFDLDLAKEESDKNPVFYVQYAYARICSVLREVHKATPVTHQDLKITEDAERELIKTLLVLPGLLHDVVENYEAHHLTTYAMAVARAFHHFYAHCRVIDQGEINPSRVALVKATKLVLKKTLDTLGVAAPEKM
ncbi:MAG: arginine--tRNA ligase [Candidatus Kerfeldbacteria bacterium CG_4_9_14_3_um_filter_45_8]|nr:MAG: arginine--tRNA ligase [Candidatus Kerfeldbacteria bacterium CG_4_9_14_3_um_filter_45_8]